METQITEDHQKGLQHSEGHSVSRHSEYSRPEGGAWTVARSEGQGRQACLRLLRLAAPSLAAAVVVGSVLFVAVRRLQPTDAERVSSRPEMSSQIDPNARFPWEGGGSESLVPLAEIIPGGPPPDGIPPVDRPTFETPDSASRWLDLKEPVVSVEVGGEARAYPIQILMWHEIVNDVVGGEPISVTYCPLCDNATVYSRRAAGRVLDLGTSGRLYKSNLVMYDRQTKSLWPQLEGRAVAGKLVGTELDIVPSVMLSFEEWQIAHPGGKVLSRSTGYNRSYGRNPYVGYDTPGSDPFLFKGTKDPRLPAVERVVGVRIKGEAKAYPLSALRSEGRSVLHDVVGGVEIVVFFDPKTVSALDDHQIAQGRLVGSGAVYKPVLSDGTKLTFVAQDKEIVDTQTNSTWNLLGEAARGPLKGSRLEAVEYIPTFWFSWAAFQPDTTIWSGS